MSEDSVRAFFAAHAPDVTIIDQGVSTATVVEAAQALSVASSHGSATPPPITGINRSTRSG